MENETKTISERPNACNFLLGKWTYCECSSLVQRFWTTPGSIRCTPRQTFTPTTGTIEYRDIVYGSHVYGEYRQDTQPDKILMSVLLQRTAPEELDVTIAASDTHRFLGTARISSGSVVLEGKAIPFFVGSHLQEARIPLVPQAESRPITPDAVCDARVALHPLRPDLWLLVFYHVLNKSSDHPTLLITEVWHFRPDAKASVDNGDEAKGRRSQPHDTPRLPLAFTDLARRLEGIEGELEEERRNFEELKNDLEDAKSEHEDALDEIVELDLVSFGWKDIDSSAMSVSAPMPLDASKWQSQYSVMLDLMEKVHELESGLESAQDEIDELELEADEIEAALDRGYSEWEAKEYHKAEGLIEQAPAPSGLPEKRLLGEAAVQRLSGDARTILETYLQLDGLYTERRDLQNLDCGPLVSSMSKLCERLLADFLGPRCPIIYADPQVASLLNDPKRTVDIPAEDQTFKIDKGSLRKVLGMIDKAGPVNWSGTRNGAIALLLFGRTYKMGDGENDEIRNPLRLHGTEEDCRDLRVALYRFQQLRNGFIHHDLAGWTEALEVKQCFERCMQGLVRILFGVSPN